MKPAEEQRTLELLSEVEARLAAAYAVAPKKRGLKDLLKQFGFGWSNEATLTVWQQTSVNIATALHSKDLRTVAALINLAALNSAIEAARLDDRSLAKNAEELRRIAEHARNLLIKQ